jgi:hypothetical protein
MIFSGLLLKPKAITSAAVYDVEGNFYWMMLSRLIYLPLQNESCAG